MAFRDFTFPGVLADLGLTLRDGTLFAGVPLADVRAEFADFVRDGAAVAAANSTEKAKSEFVIGPVLLELQRSAGGFALFSGVEWEVDPARGLNGDCDFLLTRGPSQHVLGPPFLAVAEPKNDLIRTGQGQCIAAMVAARFSNEKSPAAGRPVFGVVTTGAAWKFLCLDGDTVTMDTADYYIDNLPAVMGVLRHVVRGAGE